MQNESITEVRSWMGTTSQNLDPWLPNIFPAVAKMKGNIYATNVSLSSDDKAFMWQITGLFSEPQLYPCVLQLIMFYYCQIQHLS